ncbi:MAG: hypothetical protein ACLVDB_06130 [Anaeromassilibacillus sp.]
MERKTKTRKTRARRVKKGYETLAFGGIEDAVRLLFCEDLKPEDLEGLDLYNVAEIRRPRGGGMEIKFSTASRRFNAWNAWRRRQCNPACSKLWKRAHGR